MAVRPTNWSKTHLHPPVQEEHWWEGGSSTDEESTMSEYDVGMINLGTESPRSNSTTTLVDNTAYVRQWAEAGIEVPRVPPKRALSRSSSFGKGLSRSGGPKKELDDRDCGICFEYAVAPCRTLCCGKIFCTEHLADWLHGPNAEGRCPNCENACSLEGGTLSLATPTLRVPVASRRNTLTPSNRGAFHPSPLTNVQSHSNDTLKRPRDPSSGSPECVPSSCSTSSSSTATALSSEKTLSSFPELDGVGDHRSHRQKHEKHHILYQEGLTPLDVRSVPMHFGTTPFSTAWGAYSRLLSIITFLLFIYKLLS